MTVPRQLALDLGQRPALAREDFLVAASNAEAVAWIDRWPDWPGPALVIHGPPGCGKTHLAQVWRARTGAVPMPAEDAAEDAIEDFDRAAGLALGAVVDGVDARHDDARLLHLFNRTADAGGHLLFTARQPPARWRGRLRDLVSRLAASPTVAVAAPDDELFAAVLVKLFADRQLRVGAEVVGYLVTHMERSFAAARRTVAAADAAALAARRDITVPLIRDLLARPGAG